MWVVQQKWRSTDKKLMGCKCSDQNFVDLHVYQEWGFYKNIVYKNILLIFVNPPSLLQHQLCRKQKVFFKFTILLIMFFKHTSLCTYNSSNVVVCQVGLSPGTSWAACTPPSTTGEGERWELSPEKQHKVFFIQKLCGKYCTIFIMFIVPFIFPPFLYFTQFSVSHKIVDILVCTRIGSAVWTQAAPPIYLV
jgi:hypothetical protein